MSSERYIRGLVNEGPQDWGAAVRLIHAEYGKKAADILASALGKSRRTGERWIAKAEGKVNPKTGRESQASEPKPMAQVGVVEAAKRLYAAKKLRTAQTVNAGAVAVYSKSDGTRDARTRNVGALGVSGDLKAALDAAANDVQAGNYSDAADRIDHAVMDAYGERGGVGDLGDTLGVVDYPDGFSVE